MPRGRHETATGYVSPALDPDFKVTITGVVTLPTGVTGYTFVEQWLKADGTWGTKLGGRQGNSQNPGVPIDQEILTVGQSALCKSGDGAGGIWWELVGLSIPPGTAGCVVTNVCPIFTTLCNVTIGPCTGGSGSGSGSISTVGNIQVVTGLSVEVTCPDGSKTCYVSPTNCCPVPPPPPPPPLCASACTNGIPSVVYVRFSGFSDVGNCFYSGLNGVIVQLIYNGIAWVSMPGSTQSCAYYPLCGGGTPNYVHIAAIDTWETCASDADSGNYTYTNCGEIILACSGGNSGLHFIIQSTPTYSENPFLNNIQTWINTSAVSSVNGTLACDPFCWTFPATLTASYNKLGGMQVYPVMCSPGSGTIVVTANPSGICGTPPSTWNCNSSTGACVEVYDGSGTYSTLASCVSDCGVGSTSYNCVSGTCVQVGGTGGQYPTLAACQAACGGGAPSRMSLGTASSAGVRVNELDSGSITTVPGTKLIVNVGIYGLALGLGAANLVVQFSSTSPGPGFTLSKDSGGSLTGGTINGAYVFSGTVPLGTTSGVVRIFGLSTGAPASGAYVLASMVEVVNLANNAFDVQAHATGSTSQPDSGSVTTTVNVEYVQGAITMHDLTSDFAFGSWANSFTSGGQNVSMTLSGALTFGLTEGYRVLASTGAVDAALTGAGAGASQTWSASLASFN